MFQGFLLGIASGTSCLAYCAPIFLPFLLGEGRTVRRNIPLLVQFLAGRLGGYLAFGLAAWQVGQWIQRSALHNLLMGGSYLVLAALLIVYGFSPPKAHCPAKPAGKWLSRLRANFPAALPALLGLLTGLTLCPPFLAAFADASSHASVSGSLAFFAAFFAGTALFFIPLPFAGILRKFSPVHIVGRLACGIAGVLYLYKGVVLVYSGLIL